MSAPSATTIQPIVIASIILIHRNPFGWIVFILYFVKAITILQRYLAKIYMIFSLAILIFLPYFFSYINLFTYSIKQIVMAQSTTSLSFREWITLTSLPIGHLGVDSVDWIEAEDSAQCHCGKGGGSYISESGIKNGIDKLSFQF